MLVLPDEKGSYLYARGCYYCMSERGGEFEHAANEIVAVSETSPDGIVQTWDRLFDMNAGALQRAVDRKHFLNYREMFRQAKECGDHLRRDAEERLPQLTERGAVIRGYVIRWFLLKKVLYVQYMKDRNVLNEIHGGNVRLQRHQAKAFAENITFISYAEMWRMGKETEDRQRYGI